jgi:hypothetical protein
MKDINLFKHKNEFTKSQKNKIKSFKEIYKTYKKINWNDYKDGFNSVGDFLHQLVKDTPEVRKGKGGIPYQLLTEEAVKKGYKYGFDWQKGLINFETKEPWKSEDIIRISLPKKYIQSYNYPPFDIIKINFNTKELATKIPMVGNDYEKGWMNFYGAHPPTHLII